MVAVKVTNWPLGASKWETWLKGEELRNQYMFGASFTSAIRYVTHDKFATGLNIFSLTIGLSAALLVLLFVRHELSYDLWVPDADQVYRYEMELIDPGGNSNYLAVSPAVVKDVLSDRFPEIAAATRLQTNIHSLHVAERVHYEDVAFVEENFFEVLDIPLLEGEKSTALAGTNSVLLSEEMAIKYFGRQSPMGKTLSVEEADGGEIRDFRVTGVFRDIPENSHLDLDFLFSKQADDDVFDYPVNESWHELRVFTYLKLTQGADPELLEAAFPALLDDHVDTTRWSKGRKGSDFYRPYLVGLTDIHMETLSEIPMRPVGDWRLVYALMGIALLILVIACINFMNLALARSMTRAQEVSVRKIHGAGRRQLMGQYLMETGMLAFLALAIAIVIVWLVLPHLNAMIDKTLTIESLVRIEMLAPLVALLVFVSLSAGLYPALVLSSFRPATLLRGTHGKSSKGQWLRTALVVFQFTVSIALGIGAIIIQSQRHFTANHDLGFEIDDKLVIRYMNWGHFAEKSEAINDRIKALPAVMGTAYSSQVPGDLSFGNLPLSVPGYTTEEAVSGHAMNVDEGFFNLYGVELLAGRFLSRDYGEDLLVDDPEDDEELLQFSSLLNESAVFRLGFPSAEAALGVTLDVSIEGIEPKIVGVVRDFHFSSLREEIAPTTYYMSLDEFSNLTVRFRQGTEVPALVRDITSIWQDFIPRDPITLEYLDQNIAAFYEEDRRQGLMVGSLAILALFVASMGLYGMAALSAVESSQEVGIRKVHGASISSMMTLLMWRFSSPVLLAILFAWPLAWLGARSYLDQFSYRIDLSPWFFIAAGILALLIANLTVGGHAFRVARTNPIRALRQE